MSVLVVGISHRTAPVGVLEQVVPAADGVNKLLLDAATSMHVREAVLLATCNRIEIYAEVERFHGGVDGLAELLARHAGTALTELIPHVYVRYSEAAVSHLLQVACGLDSMVIGESQVLGQVKGALRLAQDTETIGSELNRLFQRALRVGKRAHSQTGIGRAGQSVVSVALDQARERLGDLAGVRALLIGAGSMAALAGTTLSREGAQVVVANRTLTRSEWLADSVGGRATSLDALESELAAADLVVSATGAAGTVLSTEQVRVVAADRRLVIADLALPRDVETSVASLDGVWVIDLATLAGTVRDDELSQEIQTVSDMVDEEVDEFRASARAAAVTPTVVALRTRAAEVVDDELQRLRQRVPDLDEAERREVDKTVRRVVDKLLHTPTIRVKQLAEHSGETSYAHALRQLFALDPATVDQVTAPELPAPADSPSDAGMTTSLMTEPLWNARSRAAPEASDDEQPPPGGSQPGQSEGGVR